MNRMPVRFIQPLPVAPVSSNVRTGQAQQMQAQVVQAQNEASFFDALRAVTPTLIITGIAIGIASGLGSTLGTALGTLIVSRFDRKEQR